MAKRSHTKKKGMRRKRGGSTLKRFFKNEKQPKIADDEKTNQNVIEEARKIHNDYYITDKYGPRINFSFQDKYMKFFDDLQVNDCSTLQQILEIFRDKPSSHAYRIIDERMKSNKCEKTHQRVPTHANGYYVLHDN